MASYGRNEQSIKSCARFKEKRCLLNGECTEVHDFKYCSVYQNGECDKDFCEFMHVTKLEVRAYGMTGEQSARIKREARRTLLLGGICHKFARGLGCDNEQCPFTHKKFVAQSKLYKCPVCLCLITNGQFWVTEDCNHSLCQACALRLASGDDTVVMMDRLERRKRINCPICRRRSDVCQVFGSNQDC